MQKYRSLSGVLGALPIFESAARNMSFTKAGQEFRLTQPAVSRRISSLEDQLGFPVFRRDHNKLELTPEGRQLITAVEFSLGHLSKVADQLAEQTSRRKLTIACGFSFTSMWLQPRFSRFRKVLTDVEVHLIASEFPEDLDPNMIDVRVLWDDISWPGRDVRLLFPEIVHPVCSPEFARRHRLPLDGSLPAARFREMPLLYSRISGPDHLDWEHWYRSQDMEFEVTNPHYVYDNYQFTIQAAVDGEGIALGYSGLIDDHVARNDLVRIGPGTRHERSALFIEFEPNRLSLARRDTIYHWLRKEAGLDIRG